MGRILIKLFLAHIHWTINHKTPTMKKTSTTDTPVELPFQGPEFAQKWADWLQYRKERKFKDYVPTGLKMTFAKLLRLSSGEVTTAMLIIDQSLANNWQGFFALKHDFDGTINQRPASTVGREVKFDRP